MMYDDCRYSPRFLGPARLRSEITVAPTQNSDLALDQWHVAKCAGEMKIIAFIERRQRAVVEKILRHCGLWEEESDRDPPSVPSQRCDEAD